MKQHAIAVQAISRNRKSHERPGPGVDDAWTHRDCDHDGFSHRVYTHGAGYGLWISRLLGSSRILVGKPDFRSDGAAHLWRHGQRYLAVRAVVRLYGLYHGTRRARGPHVPQRAARVS